MSAPRFQSQGRSSSPSPTGLLRRHRSANAATDHSPWRHGTLSHGGGGWGGWARPSVSPFERSGGTTVTITRHRMYREVAPAGDGHDGDDDDDDWMCDDDAFDDDEDLSQEVVRRSSWLRGYLAGMGKMSPEEINDPGRDLLCPACKGGPGGSLRFRGFQALLDHARTVRAKRVRLHRRFAEILEEELRNRRGRQGGGSEEATDADEKCCGLGSAEGLAGDRMIPWPPMVVVLNTRLGKQEGSDKWVGMGNPELLDCFREYEPVKARSAYGGHGHCGASMLVFDTTVLGYLQAQRLHDQFIQEGRGKYEWHKQKPWKQATEKRLLYGYMAIKEEELNIFGAFSGDKPRLKYEMKPYQVVVGNPLKEMHESSQALLGREITKEIERNKNLEKTCEQRRLEIEAMRRMLYEQSDEHKKEIESMNECNERLNSKLKESELERKKMQEQISSLHSTGDDRGEASSTELTNHMNLGHGEHDKPDNEMDEIAEEQRYLLDVCDYGDKKKKKPLIQGVPCN